MLETSQEETAATPAEAEIVCAVLTGMPDHQMKGPGDRTEQRGEDIPDHDQEFLREMLASTCRDPRRDVGGRQTGALGVAL